jgi:hypothetical protein
MRFEKLNFLETLELKASPAVLSVGGILATSATATLHAMNADDDGPPEPGPELPPEPGDDPPIEYPLLPPSGPAGPGS